MIVPLLIATIIGGVSSGPLVRSAPEECPLNDGNLLTVKLFIKDVDMCLQFCQSDPMCNYYQFYAAQDGKPPQCFFYETCGRTVYEAPPECVMSKENCLGIRPFVSNEGDCQKMCQKSRKCGYYKYIEDKANVEEGSSEVVPKGRQIAISRLSGADTPEFCYLLRSCSKRIIDNVLCTIGENNFLDVKLFTPDLSACRDHCENTEGCRYYYHYPISYSAAPLYCYLFQQCAAKDDEPEVALVMGGRHPGHYFMDSDDFNDVVTRNDVCPIKINPVDVGVKRAGATSHYVSERVLLCGGRSVTSSVFSDCLQYDLDTEVWSPHSTLTRPREEAAMAMVGSQLYLMGGVGEQSVEILDISLENTWFDGPELPFVLARSCAVSTGSSIIITGGHDNSSDASISTVLKLTKETGEWSEMSGMLTPRRDHACLYVELETSAGILVTGGLGENDEVLGSAEFYDVNSGEWTLVSSLKVARTEHAMSLVYGIPTIIGGVNGDQFISSMEQFDKSGNSWNIPLRRDWRIINHVLTSPRYEHTVASIPASKMRSCNQEENEV